MSVKYSILGLWLLGFSVIAPSAQAQEIVNEFPSPAGESRGLAWDGEFLWCADSGTDSVYKLDPSDGGIISAFSFSISSSYGGITWSSDNNIWIANGRYFYKVNPSNGAAMTNFHCPGG